MGWSAPTGFWQDGGVAERRSKMLRNKPRDAAVYGVDIGKNVFHVVGLDAPGSQFRKRNSGATPFCISLS
jgi:hypothetical protein